MIIALGSLALDAARLATAAARATLHRDARKGPARDHLRVDKDVVDLVSSARESRNSDILDLHQAGGVAGVAALVLACVAGVHGASNQALLADDSLDTDAVHAVDDLVVLDGEAAHGIRLRHRVATERADGNTVASAAGVAREGSVVTGLHRKAVVLVVHGAARDRQAVVPAQVKAICVLSDAVTRLRVEGQAADSGVLRVENAERAVRRVLDVEALKRRGHDVLQTEKHRAGDRRALLPVQCTLAVKGARTRDGQVGARQENKRALPFGLLECRRSFEGDGRALGDSSEVQRGACGDTKVLDHDVLARGHVRALGVLTRQRAGRRCGGSSA
ncbi:hypothetical protein ON010_g6954 [Phytophthora cinnamomi]|nr:hypothetical protein ON010_g6954 [Phytophthora cinnamomi]